MFCQQAAGTDVFTSTCNKNIYFVTCPKGFWFISNNIKNLKLQLRRSEEGWFNNKPSAGQMILSYKMSPDKDHTFQSQAVILQVQQVSAKTCTHHL